MNAHSIKFSKLILLGCSYAFIAAGCASTYSDLTSGSGLGAAEYRPAVHVLPGHEAEYEQLLGICRQAAANGQITAAQRAQLETITGAVEGVTGGMAASLETGSMLRNLGLSDNSVEDDLGVGLAVGLLSSLGSAFSSGASSTADKTRGVLLNCLRRADANETMYRVLE